MEGGRLDKYSHALPDSCRVYGSTTPGACRCDAQTLASGETFTRDVAVQLCCRDADHGEAHRELAVSEEVVSAPLILEGEIPWLTGPYHNERSNVSWTNWWKTLLAGD